MPSKKNVVKIIVLVQFFFIVPLLLSVITLFIAYKSVRSGHDGSAQMFANISRGLTTATGVLEYPAKPIFFITLLNGPVDRVLRVQHAASELAHEGIEAKKTAQDILPHLLNANNSHLEIVKTQAKLQNLYELMVKIRENITQIDTDISSTKIRQAKITVDHLTPLIGHVSDLIGSATPRKYLVFFYNNREIRPGGGFIGSFATLTFSNYSLADISVEDVYESDGQLKNHLEPHPAVRKYLQVPHLFLRDSNFSPDFGTNYQLAKILLQETRDVKDVAGAAAITTSALEDIIGAFGAIDVPDYHETITKENFYLKTQTHVEKNFFPGSTEKRGFLSAIVRQMMVNFGTVDKSRLVSSISKDVQEKQIVGYLDDKNLGGHLSALGISGKQQTADFDYLMPVDANVGANKANYYVQKSMSLDVKVDRSANVSRTFTEVFKNTSPADVFPSGTYKNYFQLYVPQNVQVHSVTVDDKPFADYHVNSETSYKNISLYFEINPGDTKKIAITYDSNEKIRDPHHSYHITMQKQIGAPNTDIRVSLASEGNNKFEKSITLSSDSTQYFSY